MAAAISMQPASAAAQTPFHANETVVFGIGLTGYVQENTQDGQTALGGGIGVMLGHGVTRYLLPLIAIDVGVVNNDAFLARTIGHADLALRARFPSGASRIAPFAQVAFSSQLIERPASADDLIRTGFTAGAGVEIFQSGRRAIEVGLRRTWLKAEDELIQAVDGDVYRFNVTVNLRPPRN